jgi:hypothetical protein
LPDIPYFRILHREHTVDDLAAVVDLLGKVERS